MSEGALWEGTSIGALSEGIIMGALAGFRAGSDAGLAPSKSPSESSSGAVAGLPLPDGEAMIVAPESLKSPALRKEPEPDCLPLAYWNTSVISLWHSGQEPLPV